MAVTRPNRAPGLVVLDAGKQGLEHFEFNRGVLLALRRAGLPFRFVGMRSMHDAHATAIDSAAAKTFAAYWWCACDRWKSAAFKVFSIVLAIGAVALARQTLLVLYATPIAHLTLALASRVTRCRLVVFLHAEIEFMADGPGRPRLLGEQLMRLSLRWSSPRVEYLTFTSPAAECVARCHGPYVTVCPHPMSPVLLGIPAASCASAEAAGKRPTALVFFKGTADSVGVRWLCNRVGREMPLNINGCYCTIPSASEVWPHIELVRSMRRFLERDELERALADAALYLMPATEDEYRFTASGLACSAASAGAAVVGCANPFMTEYQARYPTHFRLLRAVEGEDEPLPLRPGVPLDNLDEVAQVLLTCIFRGGSRPFWP